MDFFPNSFLLYHYQYLPIYLPFLSLGFMALPLLLLGSRKTNVLFFVLFYAVRQTYFLILMKMFFCLFL